MPSTAELARAARTLNPVGRQSTAANTPYDLNPLGSFGGGFSGNAYGSWLAGTPMQAGLPRSIEAFLQGAFGPLEPIMPQPIDAADETGHPRLRRLQYPIAWNLPVGIPGSEGIKIAPFQTMRNYADRYSVVRSCIRVRRDEVLGLEYDITPTDVMEKQMRFDTAAREDWMKRRKEALEFWRKPDRAFTGFKQWLGASLEELFVTDSLTYNIVPPRKDGKGLFGSNVAALNLIDGTTIRPLYDVQGGPPLPPNPAYQQYIWGVPRTDLMNVVSEEEAEELSIDTEKFSSSQILYLPYWKRIWTPYGFSPVEQSLVPLAIGISRQAYFLDYFTEGSLPGAYIVPGPEVASAAQRKQLQETLNAIAGDIGQKWKVLVLPHGSSKIDMKEVKLADGSDTVITELVMMVFAVASEELSMVPGGKSQGLGGSAHASGQDDIRRRERSKPMVGWLKDSVFDYVMQDIAGQRDMQWSWVGLDESEDAAATANKNNIYLAAGVVTIDEVRDDLSLPPFSLPLTGSPTVKGPSGGLIPLDPSIQLSPEQGAQPPPAVTAAPPGLSGRGAPGSAPPGQFGQPKPGSPPPGPPKPGAPGTPPVDAKGKPGKNGKQKPGKDGAVQPGADGKTPPGMPPPPTPEEQKQQLEQAQATHQDAQQSAIDTHQQWQDEQRQRALDSKPTSQAGQRTPDQPNETTHPIAEKMLVALERMAESRERLFEALAVAASRPVEKAAAPMPPDIYFNPTIHVEKQTPDSPDIKLSFEKGAIDARTTISAGAVQVAPTIELQAPPAPKQVRVQKEEDGSLTVHRS